MRKEIFRQTPPSLIVHTFLFLQDRLKLVPEIRGQKHPLSGSEIFYSGSKKDLFPVNKDWIRYIDARGPAGILKVYLIAYLSIAISVL